jgi:SAM-dependent methyltransferase
MEQTDVPHSRENAVAFFRQYTSGNQKLEGKKVVDLSAGSGYIAELFHKAGADVSLFDLFPGQNKFSSLSCKSIDLQKTFPIGDQSFDLAICAETIEHLPNQHFFFVETARILRPGGTLILTTPNSSSLRSRFSQFLMESEHYSNPAPNELDAFTRWPESRNGYFSKLFISGILRLRTLAALNGLKIREVHRTKGSSTSWMLMVFYPWIYYFSRRNYVRQKRADAANEQSYRQIFELNTSVGVLTSKHLIVEFAKQEN